MIKRVGFFREFATQDADASAPSIHDAVRPCGLIDESGLLAYLASGTEIFGAMGAERDAITGAEWIPGAGSLVTDGTWMWPVELRHYVERYHAELPEDFMADVRAARYTAAPVTRRRTEEIILEVFGRSSFTAQATEGPWTDGFFTWYLSDLTLQSGARMLDSLETAGLKIRLPLTGDISLSVKGQGGSGSRRARDGRPAAEVLADPAAGEVTLHLWFASDTFTTVGVRRLKGTTAAVVHSLAGLQEPEREQVVAALVRSLDQLRDRCLGFVLDRAGRSPLAAWDAVVCDGTSPSVALPDSIAVDRSRSAPPSAFGNMSGTPYGHLTVFSRGPADRDRA
ncbi:hypothetical protein [Streptomyces xantholiticus]|uniref:hypothetical protein n=1 Tax=Streptomyces xantholiticus TaxID=68285 RepID=UPI00167798BF|nr:hypothetical protein [Streptomyces xantholiticus]GGW25495.1 hypothetical protein GCM10010381_06460 [Streptomyces xantholiticus]